MANLTAPELLEDEIRAVVRAGNYRSKEEAIGHALEVLLAANPHLQLNAAVELYRQGKVTLSRAAWARRWLCVRSASVRLLLCCPCSRKNGQARASCVFFGIAFRITASPC
jgi:hypothetical protein